MLRKILGPIVFLLGLTLAGWMAYNLLIERQPQIEGRNPLIPSLVSIALIYVGWKWMKGHTA